MSEFHSHPPDDEANLNELLDLYVNSPAIEWPKISQLISDIVRRPVHSLQRISTILVLTGLPIPVSSLEVFPQNGQQKFRTGCQIEDDRLLAGIHKYRLDDWVAIARFVGNGRSRA